MKKLVFKNGKLKKVNFDIFKYLKDVAGVDPAPSFKIFDAGFVVTLLIDYDGVVTRHRKEFENCEIVFENGKFVLGASQKSVVEKLNWLAEIVKDEFDEIDEEEEVIL